MLTGARNRRSYEAAAYTEVPALRAGQLRLPHPTALDVRTMHVHHACVHMCPDAHVDALLEIGNMHVTSHPRDPAHAC